MVLPTVPHDILLLVVDKGLLALALIAASFLFGRALERYRVEAAYAQKLAERRLDAYDFISEYLLRELTAVNGLAKVLLRARAKQAAPEELDQIANDLKAFTTDSPLVPPEVGRRLAYFSPSAVTAHVAYLASILEFKGFLLAHPVSDTTAQDIRNRQTCWRHNNWKCRGA